MSATVAEKNISRELAVGADNSRTRECFVFNATREEDAVAAIMADTTTFPLTWTTTQNSVIFNFVRSTVKVKDFDDGNAPHSTWEGSVDYVLQGFQVNAPYQTGDNLTTFEIGTQTVNKKFSEDAPTTFPAAGSAPNYGHLINVTPDGVEGVDVDVPTLVLSKTFYYADADVTTAWIEDVWAVACNPINDDTFYDFAAGTLKFLGVSGTRRFNGGDWELTFKFAASPNVTGLTIGSITGIAKTGWQYLWIDYKKDEITYASTKLKYAWVAEFVYVHTVYGSSDFADLGIGTS